MSDPVVGVVMGSDSDWRVMSDAAQALSEFEVPYEVDVVSAHRMPEEMVDYGRRAEERGLRVIVAGAGEGEEAARLRGALAEFRGRLRDEARAKGAALRERRAGG